MSNFKKMIAIIGTTGGIGQSFLDQYIADDQVLHIYSFARRELNINSEKVTHHYIDICNESTIKTATESLPENLHFDIIIVATGILHSNKIKPEKTINSLTASSFLDVLQINTAGPALALKYFLPYLRPKTRAVFAVLSARVGSISDNQLGGWYSYRASKAALNMIIKTTAIEQQRKHTDHIIVGLHPGSVDTPLSKPFQQRSKNTFFTPENSVLYLSISSFLSLCGIPKLAAFTLVKVSSITSPSGS